MTSIGFIDAIRHQQPVEHIEWCRRRIVKNNWWDLQSADYVYQHSDALHLAVMYRNKDYAEYLLNNFIHECLSPTCCPIIFLAVSAGADDILELFCQRAQEAQIMYKGVPYVDARGCMLEEGRSPLHLAVQLGRLDATKILLKYGANPQATDVHGLTALERGLQSLILMNDELDSFSQAATTPDFIEKHPTCVGLKIRCHGIVLALLELSDCMIAIDKESIPFLRGLLKDCFDILPREFFAELVELHFLMEKMYQPPSLIRLTRFMIRGHLGYRHLPRGVEQLGLPPLLNNYILHNIKE